MLTRAEANRGQISRLPISGELHGAIPRSSYSRFAIYYTPQPGTPLAAFGRSWFGRANDGATLQAFSDAGLTGESFIGMPLPPARYRGLHAAFRAPFALRDGMGPDALRARLKYFAERRKAVHTGPLTLARHGGFLVLRPLEPLTALDWLAAQCVSAFDGFRALPDGHDDEESPAPRLSDHQRLLLASFGDANVLSEYRFEITLAGPLDGGHLERVTQALWPMLQEICAEGVMIDALSLLGEPHEGAPLRLIARYRLGA